MKPSMSDGWQETVIGREEIFNLAPRRGARSGHLAQSHGVVVSGPSLVLEGLIFELRITIESDEPTGQPVISP